MRGLESLMLAGLAALLGLGVWQGRNWLPNLLPNAGSAPVTASPGAQKKIDSKPKAKKHRLVSGAAVNAKFAAVDRLAAGPGGSTVVLVPLPSMPTSRNIKAGTSRTDLRARYGDPTLNVSSRREGRLIERYYYLSDDQTILTVATLQDGTVTSAETVSR